MPSRHKARQRAVQILYLLDMRKQDPAEALEGFYSSLAVPEGAERVPRDTFLEELVRGTIDRQADIDARITRHAARWRMERMPTVDRNILRLAVYEMLVTDTPPPVLIDEALELARQFAGEESVHFVNGVLDAVHRELAAAAPQA